MVEMKNGAMLGGPPPALTTLSLPEFEDFVFSGRMKITLCSFDKNPDA
jgi:hypothetical protein